MCETCTQPGPTYLDSINNVPNAPGKYKVETATSPHRDGGSGTWQLQAQSSSIRDGKVSCEDVVQFINQHGANGGFLDTYGNSSAGSGALYDVITSYYSDRDSRLTASWKITLA